MNVYKSIAEALQAPTVIVDYTDREGVKTTREVIITSINETNFIGLVVDGKSKNEYRSMRYDRVSRMEVKN